ncbi:MAG: hypothetical protein L0H84_23080 [Pseudonocardia sp.]|nr:hypothetical protein [Pseudonocardia sp.]
MRKSVLLAAVTAAALALAGCGGATTAGTPAPAAPVPVASITDAGQLADALTKATQGKNSATMKMEITAAGQTFGGDGAYSINGDAVTMRLNFTLPGQAAPLELRLVDRTIYVKLPAGAGGQGWLKVPVDANNPQTAEFAKLIDQVDIAKQYDQFRTAGVLKGQAPDTVDGVPTTRYDLTVDVAEAIAAAPSEEARTQLEPLAQAGVKTLDMQIWADAENLPRQIRSSFTAQGQNASATIKLSDWGAPVTVEAPPADQVLELPAGG